MLIRTHCEGFSLIETLIALLIISLALLVVIGSEVNGLRLVKSTYYYNVAIQQASNLFERLKANQDKLDRQQTIALWQQQTQQLLPHFNSNINCQNTVCSITLQWDYDHKTDQIKLQGTV